MAHGGNAPVLPGTTVPIVPSLRRFELPDFSTQGQWMGQRLMAAFSHLSERQLFGWLNGLIYSPEYLFLWQTNSIALAQAVHSFTLSPHPVVQEHFVFVRERENPHHLEEASEFYAEFVRWGKSKDAEALLLADASDVPPEMVKKRIGKECRIMTRQQTFIKW